MSPIYLVIVLFLPYHTQLPTLLYSPFDLVKAPAYLAILTFPHFCYTHPPYLLQSPPYPVTLLPHTFDSHLPILSPCPLPWYSHPPTLWFSLVKMLMRWCTTPLSTTAFSPASTPHAKLPTVAADWTRRSTSLLWARTSTTLTQPRSLGFRNGSWMRSKVGYSLYVSVMRCMCVTRCMRGHLYKGMMTKQKNCKLLQWVHEGRYHLKKMGMDWAGITIHTGPTILEILVSSGLWSSNT